MIIIDILGEDEDQTIQEKIEKQTFLYESLEIELQLIERCQEEDNTNHWLLYQESILYP